LLQEFSMNTYLRLAAGLSCLSVLVLAAVALDPNDPFLSSFQSCWATRATPAEEIEHWNQLEEAVRRRREGKLLVAEEVIARRRSLAEAIERFRKLDRHWSILRIPHLKAALLGISEDESVGRNVLFFVQVVLVDRPDEAAAVVARLTKELQELLADHKKCPAAPDEARIESGR
jgi:hypothetical protein